MKGLLPLVRQSGRGSALTGWDLEEEEKERKGSAGGDSEEMKRECGDGSYGREGRGHNIISCGYLQ